MATLSQNFEILDAYSQRLWNTMLIHVYKKFEIKTNIIIFRTIYMLFLNKLLFGKI